MPTEQHHAHTTEDKWQSGQQSGLGVAHAKAFDDSWQEEGNSIARCVHTEINQSGEQDADIRKRLEQRKMFDLFLVSFLGFLHTLKPSNFIFLQPAGLARKAGKENNTPRPTRTDGSASMMNSHCQPSSPKPVTFSKSPEIGAPTMDEIGIASMKKL